VEKINLLSLVTHAATHVKGTLDLCYNHTKRLLGRFEIFGSAHTQDVHEYDYISRRLLRLFEYNYAVRRDYSSLGRTGSTSTLPCVASTCLSAVAALHRLRRTPPRCRLLGVRLLRLLISTSKLVEGGYYVIDN
jgi:hypothetical protein